MGIARSTWYRHTTEPLFRARAQAVFKQSCDDALGPVLHALVESAKLFGKDGHQDRRLYLGLLGIYEQGASGKSKDEEEKKPASTMTDAELLNHFADRPHLLPPGVQRRMGIEPQPPAQPAAKKAT